MTNAFAPSEIKSRIRAFRSSMKQKGLDGFLVSDPQNVRYLSGFTGDDSFLFVPAAGRLKLLTDFRLVEEAHESCVGTTVVDCRKKGSSHFGLAAGFAAAVKGRKPVLGIEAQSMSTARLATLKRVIAREKKRWSVKPQNALVEALRLIKSPAEVKLIRKAVRIQEEAYTIIAKWVKPGMTELQVAARLEYEMKGLGAMGASFATIVAEGPRGSLPHAMPTARRIKKNSPILIDWGARYRFYNSDLTRVLFMGTIRPVLRNIYTIVLRAQVAAIAAVKPGVSCKEVDAVARDIIKDAGYGKAFGHGTGHGIGLYIHEGPRLNWADNTVLKPGMVVTVEPGIYLPGKLGVRIEDDILVTARGHSVLSRLPKSL